MKKQFPGDATCFKCFAYYFKQNLDVKNNCMCMKCDTRNSLWFCLKCAHIGCGRSVNAHAKDHYQTTKHFWVMNLETFQIWDYKQSAYVQHNLNNIQIPKISQPNPTCTDATVGSAAHSQCPCPICRHMLMPKLSNVSICMTCGAKQKLWLCLTCGHMGCGRNSHGHALKHYSITQHPQVMHFKTFSIWDYKDEKYLHRCINDITPKVEIFAELEKDKNSENLQVFEERMQRLENEWGNFCTLKETNQQIISIERRLIALCEAKQKLEQKIIEHDNKLNDLLNNFKANNQDLLITSTSTNVNSRDDWDPNTTEDVQNINITLITSQNTEQDMHSTISSLNVPDSAIDIQAILFIFFLLFVYQFVNLFVHAVSGTIFTLK